MLFEKSSPIALELYRLFSVREMGTALKLIELRAFLRSITGSGSCAMSGGWKPPVECGNRDAEISGHIAGRDAAGEQFLCRFDFALSHLPLATALAAELASDPILDVIEKTSFKAPAIEQAYPGAHFGVENLYLSRSRC